MKKLIGLAILVSMIFIGCGSKAENNTPKVKEMVVGTNGEYKPMEYYDNGKLVGFDIEFMEAIAKKMGVKVKWKDMTFDGLIPAMQTGKIDMIIAGMSATPERKKAVDFSMSYEGSEQILVINKINKDNFTSATNLKGIIIGTQLGSLQEKLAYDHKADKVKLYSSFTASILELVHEKVDGVIVGGREQAEEYIANNENLMIVGQVPSTGGSAIAMPKGSTKLLAEVNKQMEVLIKDGTYAKLRTKYGLKIELH